ncbi:FAD-dependent monooxygenase [Rhodococcus sp. IEGM 1341]|uniref:FAD-dependent monooxygenase n=1 Tax=Rhodococcus sp. IEGM 1341 TaxID=3047090 RepID=UPI0024B73597|nr:FAD-dependent monooxygenase [Rhodococcus sp. IEGM 1341]MDI9927948.1 FAD-dependent monooxygenase [Rhodococcus sp. IEGM 1341]
MTSRVLVTGASIAGPTVAFWLDRAGFEVTVLERSPHLRLGGQNIDVRGSGREVLRRMGLDATLLANGTTEKGTRFVDDADATIAAFPAGDGSHDGPTAELEILRGEFARILVESAGPRTEYRYGDRVVGVTQDAAGVDVTFATGTAERFDLVLFADGIRSSSRELVFAGEAETTPVGLYTAYGVLPKGPSDDGWWRWYNAPGSRVVNLRPDNLGTTRSACPGCPKTAATRARPPNA